MNHKRIQLYSGDTYQTFTVQLLDYELECPFDVGDVESRVMFHFQREADSCHPLFAVECEKIIPELGIVRVTWPNHPIRTMPGYYEGVFVFNTGTGQRRTVRDRLSFKVDAVIHPNCVPCYVDMAGVKVVDGQIYLQNQEDGDFWHKVAASGEPQNPYISLDAGKPLEEIV